MQGDKIDPKIVGLAPAHMDRLPPSIIPTKIFLEVNNLVRQPEVHLHTLILPCFTRKIVRFLLVHSPSTLFLDFYDENRKK
jgi:hypothetical protein